MHFLKIHTFGLSSIHLNLNRETLEHFIVHCPRWEEWRIESRSLHRPRIEETDQVLGEFLFGGHESNMKKRTQRNMWNERHLT